jgi:hypothetical protein
MKELLPKGAMEEGKLPIFLTTWTDKTSPLCMFIHGHIRAWSVPHLKLGCWYLDCAKGFCPEDKEDLKKSIEIAGGTIDLTAAADVEDPQEDDLQHLDEKEKKEKEKEAERARKKKERQEEKATEKAGEKSKKSSRSSEKASIPEVDFPESSSALPSGVARKRDASYAGLPAQRLQAGSSPAFKDHVNEGITMDEFIYPGSLLTMDTHYFQHNKFPQGWKDLIAFLEKVSLCSS